MDSTKLEPQDESWSNKDDPLATRMKEYEKESFNTIKLDSSKPWIARLDGHRFSQFTKGFLKPFDVRIFNAMRDTTADLLTQYKPMTAYTQSDEITLLFPVQYIESSNKQTIQTIEFNGKIQKMVSLMSSYCSIRFIYHLLKNVRETVPPLPEAELTTLTEKIFTAHFDARLFNVPSDSELTENIIWRIKDIKRNSKNNLGHFYFKQNELAGLNPGEVIDRVQKEKGLSWATDMPNEFKYGIFIKKGTYPKECLNPKTGEQLVVTRSRLMIASLNVWKAEEDSIKLVCEKHSNDTGVYAAQFTPLKPTDN